MYEDGFKTTISKSQDTCDLIQLVELKYVWAILYL